MRRDIRIRLDEYRQALDRFQTAKAGFANALDQLDRDDVDLHRAGERLAAAYAELTEAQADAAGIRNLLTEPVDTAAPVWNIEDDLRRVEADIAALTPQLQRLGITPPSPAPPPITEPEPEPAPEPEPPPRTREEFFARGAAEFRMTSGELRRRFRALPDDPQQVEMAWRTLQIITQPKPEPVWPDHDPPDHDPPDHDVPSH